MISVTFRSGLPLMYSSAKLLASSIVLILLEELGRKEDENNTRVAAITTNPILKTAKGSIGNRCCLVDKIKLLHDE